MLIEQDRNVLQQGKVNLILVKKVIRQKILRWADQGFKDLPEHQAAEVHHIAIHHVQDRVAQAVPADQLIPGNLPRVVQVTQLRLEAVPDPEVIHQEVQVEAAVQVVEAVVPAAEAATEEVVGEDKILV